MTREEDAFRFLCERLQRDFKTAEESDTISLRAACRAMVAFADRQPPDPSPLTQLEQAA